MEPFTTQRGQVALLDWTDVNTDLIIPARYLKRIERTGYGPLLFADKRYEPGTAPPPDEPDRIATRSADFPLNLPEVRGGDDPGRRQELRLRVEPRARRLGRGTGGIPRADRPRDA